MNFVSKNNYSKHNAGFDDKPRLKFSISNPGKFRLCENCSNGCDYI